MPLFQVSSNRAAGEREYEVETIMWALDAKAAALRFVQDWLDLGWRPGVILVGELEVVGPLKLFRVESNLLYEE